jgi:hypothetical protein
MAASIDDCEEGDRAGGDHATMGTVAHREVLLRHDVGWSWELSTPLYRHEGTLALVAMVQNFRRGGAAVAATSVNCVEESNAV